MVDPMTINYNLTKMADSTSVVNFVSTVNQYSGGTIFHIFIVGIFVIILLALSRFGFDNAFATASFICFVLSAFLALAKLVEIYFPLVFLIFTMLAALYLYSTRGA